MNRLIFEAEELLRDTERRETRSAKMGVGARKARSETRKAVRRIKGERVWYRWFIEEGMMAVDQRRVEKRMKGVEGVREGMEMKEEERKKSILFWPWRIALYLWNKLLVGSCTSALSAILKTRSTRTRGGDAAKASDHNEAIRSSQRVTEAEQNRSVKVSERSGSKRRKSGLHRQGSNVSSLKNVLFPPSPPPSLFPFT